MLEICFDTFLQVFTKDSDVLKLDQMHLKINEILSFSAALV